MRTEKIRIGPVGSGVIPGGMTRRDFVKAATAGVAMSLTAPLFVACSRERTTEHSDAGVPNAYAGTALDLIATTPGFSPPVASRVLALMGVALYESVAPGMDGFRPLAAVLPQFPITPISPGSEYHWPTVASHAMSRLLERIFPPDSPAMPQFAALRELFDADVSLPRMVRARSTERGATVADMVYLWSTGDGGHEGHLRNFPADYQRLTGPGLWEPTPPAFLETPLQPYWGTNRPFSSLQCAVGPPPPYSEDPASDFFSYATEVYEQSLDLTLEQQEIALFWADDPGTVTPPGHSVSMLRDVLIKEEADLQTAAEAYLRVGCAVADAFIQCWAVKYTWNLVRPVTFIRAHLDPEWTSLVPTPPFPEYSSGHSTQSGAWAEVMTAMFGDGYKFTDRTHEQTGLAARTYHSFHLAAEEAAVSRLYGGIHYRFANERGLEAGRCIGRAAAEIPLRA
jgi:hypothetical protein